MKVLKFLGQQLLAYQAKTGEHMFIKTLAILCQTVAKSFLFTHICIFKERRNKDKGTEKLEVITK